MQKNSPQVFLTFLSILVRLYLNNVLFIYNELETYPGISYEQLYSFQNSGTNLAYDLLLSFCVCVILEPFEKTYQSFVPVLDYNLNCFKL